MQELLWECRMCRWRRTKRAAAGMESSSKPLAMALTRIRLKQIRTETAGAIEQVVAPCSWVGRLRDVVQLGAEGV
jgi:hypothetical protein